jgi:HTH-type transcriptional regulator / antitoxin HigA
MIADKFLDLEAAMTATTASPAYFDLVRRFPLRPLRSDEDLDRAIEVINALISRDDLDEGEEDYLEILSEIVERYEDEHYPMDDVSSADMLRHLIEFRGVTQAEVAAGSGLAASAISELIAGKRAMGRKTIETLARYFRVDPGLFLPRGGTGSAAARG